MLQLATERKLSLDDPLSKYEPQVPNSSNITVRMLLAHTSGLFSYTEDAGFQKAIETDPLKTWTPDESYTTWMWYIPSKKATVIAFFNETSTFTPSYEVKEQTALQELLQTAVMTI